VISPHWTHPKCPRYWHYDMLGGLVAMAEMELIEDLRCADALDLLERKELPMRCHRTIVLLHRAARCLNS